MQGTALNGAKTTGIVMNSPYDHLINRKGTKVQKVGHTLNGNDAQLDNIFAITGAVEIIALWAECTEATNATTCGTCYFDLYDSTAAVEITDNGGVDLAAITVGSIVGKISIATAAAVKMGNAVGFIVDGVGASSTAFCPFIAVKKTGAATYIRFCFTGDANTDVDMTFNVRYVPISSDGAIAAV